MKIQYIYKTAISDGAQAYYGSGNADSFGIGFSTTTHSGTFTNTSPNDLLSPILVVAAKTSRKMTSVSRINSLIARGDIPFNVFFFIPSVATAHWYFADTGSNQFWASLPQYTLAAGKSYRGYYVPLTALPPFSSRAEIGTVEPTSVNMNIKSLFLLSSVYFDPTLHKFADRITRGTSMLTVSGGDLYTVAETKVANANSQINASDLLYGEAATHGTPYCSVNLTGVTTFSGDSGATSFRPTLSITTKAPSKKPSETIRMKGKSPENLGRHGLDTIGNSGYTNNRDISFDSVITKKKLAPNLKTIRFGSTIRSVAGIDYLEGDNKRVNVFLEG